MKLHALILASLIVFSCSNPKVESKETTKDSTELKPAVEFEHSSEESDFGPPFNDTCLCNFKDFGEYKISNDNYNIYLSGKGWNPKFYSCSWPWGEIINNQMPEDTNVTVVKVHLLDLDTFAIPTNMTEYGNDSIKKYVIAVSTNTKCVFDPYKTGKYPKPKQWVEE